MKASITTSLLILAIGAALGWHDRQQLATLRTTHERLIVEAAKLGVSPDAGRITRRERPSHAATAKLTMAEVMGLAGEMERLNAASDENQRAFNALQLRISEGLTAWDATGLKALFAEMSTNQVLTPALRGILGSSCTTVLANDHPQAALEIFTSSPEFFTGGDNGMSLVCTALASWARDDLTAAIEWLRKNPQPFSDYAKSGIISAVAEQDPHHAFQLIAELEMKESNQAAWSIVESAKTFEEKSATLAGLREYLPTIPDEKLRDQYAKTYLSMLAAHMDREGIEAITRWISEAKLSPQELDPMLGGLVNAIHSHEADRWIEWMRQLPPAQTPHQRIKETLYQWTCRDYQAALQWAVTQPPGKDRDQVLKTIHGNWPKQDPVGMEAFAKEHGIK
jgi:hypothetical protein